MNEYLREFTLFQYSVTLLLSHTPFWKRRFSLLQKNWYPVKCFSCTNFQFPTATWNLYSEENRRFSFQNWHSWKEDLDCLVLLCPAADICYSCLHYQYPCWGTICRTPSEVLWVSGTGSRPQQSRILWWINWQFPQVFLSRTVYCSNYFDGAFSSRVSNLYCELWGVEGEMEKRSRQKEKVWEPIAQRNAIYSCINIITCGHMKIRN